MPRQTKAPGTSYSALNLLQRYNKNLILHQLFIDISSIQPVSMSGLLFLQQAVQELLGSTVAFLQLMILAELLEGFLVLC